MEKNKIVFGLKYGRWIILVVVVIGSFLAVKSCRRSRYCEAFDFNRIDSTILTFYDSYKFVSGDDSVCFSLYESCATVASLPYYGSCWARWELRFRDKALSKKLSYSFSYYQNSAEYTKTNLDMIFMNGFHHDPANFENELFAGQCTLRGFDNLGKGDSTRDIRYLKLMDMIPVEFETTDGRVWKLSEKGEAIPYHVIKSNCLCPEPIVQQP
jgi:hypothetical protein